MGFWSKEEREIRTCLNNNFFCFLFRKEIKIEGIEIDDERRQFGNHNRYYNKSYLYRGRYIVKRTRILSRNIHAVVHWSRNRSATLCTTQPRKRVRCPVQRIYRHRYSTFLKFGTQCTCSYIISFFLFLLSLSQCFTALAFDDLTNQKFASLGRRERHAGTRRFSPYFPLYNKLIYFAYLPFSK